MLTNYLKIALRQLVKDRLYALINILGLAIGMGSCILILLFVRFEMSYEQGFSDADRIYRISREYFPIDGARLRVPASNNGPVAEALLQDFNDIEVAGRFFRGTTTLQVGEVILEEDAVPYTDQQVLQVFDFQWLAGDSLTALSEPGSIVLTETLAQKYFASADALGRNMSVQGGSELRVTGIIKDLPQNTHLHLTGMISMNTLRQFMGEENYQNNFGENWNSNTDFHTYFKLRAGADISLVEQGIPEFMDRHIAENASEASTMLSMQVGDIHLYSDRDEEWLPPGNIATVYSLAAIAFSILLIACLNFMSISTSRSSRRSREIGVRLAMGATRKELIMQFLGESSVTALISMILALGVVELLLPAFSSFVGIDLGINLLGDMNLLLSLLLFTLFIAFFSGAYPAFYLSSARSVNALKGESGLGYKSLIVRNAMVILQFSIAIALVIATSVIFLQRQFATEIDMGFEKDAIVVLPSAQSGSGYLQDWALLKQRLMEHSAIENVTVSHFLPFGFNDNQYPIRRRGTTGNTRIQGVFVSYDYFDTFEIPVLAGRGFNLDIPSEALSMPSINSAGSITYVINESAARELGFPAAEYEDQELEVINQGAAVLSGPVIGVVADTYFESIRRDVRPLIFVLTPPGSGVSRMRDASIRINPAMTDDALAHIDAVWNELYPGLRNARYFLDDDFQAMYVSEERQGQMITWFSVLAITISCFGLFGLASFNAERRTKEIGVRKVMGSSAWKIIVLLSNDFSRLVLLSNLIAWPVAYIAMNQWLSQFVYRIDLTLLLFIGSGLVALCIAWVTVGGTAAKAANQKPVLALRYE